MIMTDENESEFVSVQELSRELGISDSLARKYCRVDGMMRHLCDTSRKSTRVHLEQARACLAEFRQNSVRYKNRIPDEPKDAPAEDEDEAWDLLLKKPKTKAQADLAKAVFAAEKARIDLESLKGRYVKASVQENLGFEFGQRLKSTLLALPARLAPPLMSKKGVWEIERYLEQELRALAEEFSSGRSMDDLLEQEGNLE